MENVRISKFRHYWRVFVGFILGIFHARKAQVWDMDGCIVNIYEKKNFMDKLSSKKFFFNSNAYYGNIQAIKIMMWNHPEDRYYICSKPMTNEHCIVEKDGWMNTFLPQIPWIDRIYVPMDANKSEYVRKFIKRCRKIYFYDDYTANLRELEDSGICHKLIKVKNQINCQNGTWDGNILLTYEDNVDENGNVSCKPAPIASIVAQLETIRKS